MSEFFEYLNEIAAQAQADLESKRVPGKVIVWSSLLSRMDEPMQHISFTVGVKDCPDCEGTGWRWDDTACGDPDHCSPQYACHTCNPEGKDE